ncbi:hypothetical protein ACL7B0_04160 [Bordetella pertussis]
MLMTGERRIVEIIDRFGQQAFKEGMAAMLDYSEQQARVPLCAPCLTANISSPSTPTRIRSTASRCAWRYPAHRGDEWRFVLHRQRSRS